jgi:drug/metabolite transporter (DMT)-like permease
MIGVCYLLLALGCWTVWAVLSARLGGRFSPLNSLLWTGLVSALITLGGFAIHFRQLRVPGKADWWLLAIFCGANTVACFGYYAALRHLPGSVVLPFSHLYLVIGPLVLAIRDRQALGWQQFAALCIIMGGVVLFLAAAPVSQRLENGTAEPQSRKQSLPAGADEFYTAV